MGEQITKVVNVTIHYPDGIPTFMDFAGGKVKNINVHVEVRPVSEELIGDYTGDSEFRVRFQSELNRLWENKEQTLQSLEKTISKR